MKLVTLLCLTALSASAMAADCTDPRVARKHKQICSRLIDTSKLVLKDCTGDLEDGYSFNHCAAADIEQQIYPSVDRFEFLGLNAEECVCNSVFGFPYPQFPVP